MRQERWFSDIQKPFQQNGKESVYKGFNYNINVPLSPLELEACQGKTVCVLSSLKTDTPGICRVQVVAFKGKVVTGCMQSDALPKDRSGYLFTALHFDFKDYDSVWVRPLMVGGKQDATISAWTYSTWITDIPISKQEASQIKVAVNSKNTAGFVFPHSPLVYPYFSKDHTTAESFLPAKSYSLDTGNRLFQEFLTNMAGDEGSSSFQTALAVTPYIKNHVLQHAPFKDKDFPDLKTRSQSLLAMTAEALYGDSTQDFLDKSKIFYTKEIPFQELSKAYQTHHEILGHMLPASWQEMIKKQGKTALTPHSNSLAKWSILHDVATEMGRRCGIPVPSVFSTLDVIQSITNAGFEFFALEPEDRKVFCQQFDGFGKSLCDWLDYNFEPLFDGVLLLTTKGQGKGVPVKWPQLKPKIQLKLEMKAQPKPQQPIKKLEEKKKIEVQEYSKETQQLVGRTDQKYKPELLEREGAPKGNTTLKAAEQELKGNQIDLAKQRGVTYDHVAKVRQAQKGLSDHIKDINNRLSYPKLPDVERKALQEELSKASKLLDHSEQFVPRMKK
jgi:hypothetical protein